MNYFSFIKYSLVFLLGMLLIISCQKDSSEVINTTPDGETITINSPLTELLRKASLHDANNDDFIDGSGCFSVNFPFTVVVSEVEITVENETDYQDIIDMIMATGTSVDAISISYPIVITFLDYTEIVVNNEQELIGFVSQCESNEIECIDCAKIVYPVQIFTFNSETEQTITSNFLNDKELFTYITQLTETYYLTIDYPVSVSLNTGNIVQANTNEQLKNLISNCENQGANELDEIANYLSLDSWYISNFYNNNDDATSNYCEFQFNFSTEGYVEVKEDSTIIAQGSWELVALGNTKKILLNLPNEIPFEALNDDWEIINSDVSTFNLGADDENNLLSFSRDIINCNDGSVEELKEYLKTGSWYVSYFYTLEDTTSDFCEYEFVFNDDASITATYDGQSVEGDWYVGNNNQGIFLGLNFVDADLPISSLFHNWNVINYNLNTIETENNCDCGLIHNLSFGRSSTICEDNSEFLEDVLGDGIWLVSEFFNNGTDESLNYIFYSFNFNIEDNTVTVLSDIEVINGTWSVLGDEGDLELILDFENIVPFDELNNNWNVQDILIGRVKLENIDGSNEDTITFTKLIPGN